MKEIIERLTIGEELNKQEIETAMGHLIFRRYHR